MLSTVAALGRRLDLNLLIAFDAIYEARGITAAAHAMALSQPAMSHALARLRAAFDDPLFVRMTGGLRPTPLAEEIAPRLRAALAIVRGTLDRTPFDPRSSRRVFRARMGDIAEVLHLPRLVSALNVAAPHVRVESVAMPDDSIGDALAAGEIDIAAGRYRLGRGCRELELEEGDYACIVRAAHRSIGARLGLRQFRAASHIDVLPKGVSRQVQVMRRVLAAGRGDARVAVQLSNFYAVMEMVAQTDLVATIPRPLAESMRRSARIRVVNPPVELPKFRVLLYWHERFDRDPGHAWLRQMYAHALYSSVRTSRLRSGDARSGEA